jgi:hypothetical protein
MKKAVGVVAGAVLSVLWLVFLFFAIGYHQPQSTINPTINPTINHNDNTRQHQPQHRLCSRFCAGFGGKRVLTCLCGG